MDFEKEMIRPSRNKHRSNAVMAMRLLERRETVAQLEQTLTRTKADLQREAATSQGLWKQVKAKQKQLECDSEVHRRTFEGNEEVKKKALQELEREEDKCCLLDEESSRLKLEMEQVGRELLQLSETICFLQKHQQSMGDLEDFDFVLSKFQELNSIWQEMADDYRLLMDRYRTDTRASEHSTESVMHGLMNWIERDRQRRTDLEADTNRFRTARNSAWKVRTYGDTSRQFGHLYMAITNLANHLAEQSVCRTLTDLNTKDSRRGGNHRRHCGATAGGVRSRDTAETARRIPEKWQKFAASVLAEHRLKGGDQAVQSDSDELEEDEEEEEPPPAEVPIESDRVSESDKAFSYKVISTTATIGDQADRKAEGLTKTAVAKLNYIEQILTDLSLVKEEIDFHTDPIHYNDPGNSFIT